MAGHALGLRSHVGPVEGFGVVDGRQLAHQLVGFGIGIGPLAVVQALEEGRRPGHLVVADHLDRIGDVYAVLVAATVVPAEAHPDDVVAGRAVGVSSDIALNAGARHAVADLQAGVVALVETRIPDRLHAVDVDRHLHARAAIDCRRNAQVRLDHPGVFERGGRADEAMVLRLAPQPRAGSVLVVLRRVRFDTEPDAETDDRRNRHGLAGFPHAVPRVGNWANMPTPAPPRNGRATARSTRGADQPFPLPDHRALVPLPRP